MALRLTSCRLFQLTSQDKTPSVVQRALQKHSVSQPWVRDYQLFQVLPGDRGKQGQLGGSRRGGTGKAVSSQGQGWSPVLPGLTGPRGGLGMVRGTMGQGGEEEEEERITRFT